MELNGRVAEIGTVADPGFDALRASFATASLITGQYFLARIDTKLNAIFKNVQEILRQFEFGERATLNLATTFLQFLATTATQGRPLAWSESEIRPHRAGCLLIAERNLIALEDRLIPTESRKALGAKERFGQLSSDAVSWISNKTSTFIPSSREDELLTELKEFAKEVTRGLVALQASLCLEAILEPFEAHSPTGLQVLSIKERYRAVLERFQGQFQQMKDVALQDWRYWEAEEKRQRLLQEVNSLLSAVTTHWDVMEDLELQWHHRAVSVPETIYVEVNEIGQPVQLFLPDA